MIDDRYAGLSSHHVVRTLAEEHDMLLGLLDLLDELINEYRDAIGTADAAITLARIHGIAEELVAAEPHHRREEEVLFPELRRHGLVGPPACMEEEHVILRSWKHDVVELSRSVGLDTEELAETVARLSSMLRDHIRKENEILYPMALSQIAPERFEEMRADSDRIGPCRFMQTDATRTPDIAGQEPPRAGSIPQ